ncbi:LPS export ABC transporter periplasmic protein LptC [Marinomonas sp. C2222]|uniref:LPS export ABC transporter periplasmic protein LptC n=1 Tax=Marinomonas sargassi TaxID=2984494 RepID=A0ABT2YT35_9GAMM|nr:LPS export ABC transporter periplasmic protein LptC [Marinomonas sargassi]MCV2403059.1 LPS export ABC transporter periplasmic protein LptC [Marinomonas sargassi]
MPSNLVETTALSSSPDYFITDISVKTYDSDGKLVESINALQASHFIRDSKTLLDSPNVSHYSTTGSWSASADTGVLHDGNNDILLMDNVFAKKSYPSAEDITLKADEVHYLDEEQSLTSQGNAKLISTQGETSAKKITSYINSDKVIMTELVRGYYEASH